MLHEHDLSEDGFAYLQAALATGRHWLAYNSMNYYLDKPDLFVFSKKDEAKEFSANNTSAYDDYKVVWVDSITDLQERQSIHIKKLNFMNENNFKYLEDQIFYKNFGRGHADELREKMKSGKTEFMLTHQQDYGKDNTVATLHFKKSAESDMYFFNSYSLMVKAAGQKDPLKQTFYINNDPKKREQEDITLKEGYNLLSGRSVNKNLITKEGVPYNAWVQLDFKTTDKHGNYEEKKFHKNYGFSLEESLAKHPLKELADEKTRVQLIDSLKRGNRQAATFQYEGSEKKVFIEAAPQFKSLNFYDGNMKRLSVEALYEKKSEVQVEKNQQGKSKGAKQDAGSDEEGDGVQSNRKASRKKGQGIS